MKILKISLIAFVILVLVLIVSATIFVATFDVNRFKPQIKDQISKALNRQLDFQKANLSFSFRQGISLKINNLVVADDPVFQKADFLTVNNISLAVDILGYIFKKQINVPNVLIDTPQVTIIRQKDGSLNVQSLAKSNQAEKNSLKPASVATAMAIPAILISSLRADNGLVTFIDNSFDPPLRLEISQLSFSLSKISLTAPFPFVAEGAILSSKKNIRIEGKLQVDLKTSQFTISELKGMTDLSDILLEKIPHTFPMVKGMVLPVNLKGKLNLLINNLVAGPGGLTALAGDVSLTNAAMQFNQIALPIKDISMNMKITEKKILFEKATAAIGQGIINGSGSLEDYLAEQNYSFTAQAENLNLEDFINQEKSQAKAEGIASAKVKFNGQGFTAQALQTNLSGDIDISITKAKLKDINVLRTVLDKISIIPGLAQKVQAGLSERFKQKLTQKDTVLSDIKLPVAIENGRLVVKNAVLGADEFLFNGQGQAGFDGAYSLEGTFLVPQELSAAMVTQVPELQYILNEEKQIYFPLKVSGKAGELKFNVDSEYIARRLIVDQAKKQIFKALDKALGTKEPQSTEQPAAQPEGLDQQPTTEESIGNVLRGIFNQ